MMKKIIALALAFSMLPIVYAESIPQTTVPNTTMQVVVSNPETVMTDEQARDMVRVTYSPIPLRSKLKKMYSAYQVTLSSEYPGTLNIQSANITNGTPGVAAAQTVYTSRANMWWGALLGIGGIIVIGLPILGIISSSNGKAEKESVQFPNQVPFTDLHKGETVSFKALTLLGQTPQVSLSFKDPKSSLAFTKNTR